MLLKLFLFTIYPPCGFEGKSFLPIFPQDVLTLATLNFVTIISENEKIQLKKVRNKSVGFKLNLALLALLEMFRFLLRPLERISLLVHSFRLARDGNV